MNATPLKAMNKAPKPIWPWIVGAAAIVGGYKLTKDRKMKVHHRAATPLTKEKTDINIIGKRE